MDLRPRLRLRTMVGLVAVSAVGLTVWNYLTPGSTLSLSRVLRYGPEYYLRSEAALSLGERPESDAGIAVPALLASLHDTSPTVRGSSATSLRKFSQRDRGIIPALIATLLDEDDTVRLAALDSLCWIATEPGGAQANQAVLGALADSSLRVRQKAALVVGQMGLVRRAAAAVSRDLVDQSYATRRRAVSTLRKIGPDACKFEVQSLLPLLDDPSPTVALEAAHALTELRPAEVTAALTRLSADQDRDVAGEAQELLSALWQVDMEGASIPRVIELATAGSPGVRLTALTRLEQIGPAAAEAVPALTAMTRDADIQIRVGALQALAGIGVASPETFDELLRALKVEEDPALRPLIAAAMEAVSRPPAR